MMNHFQILIQSVYGLMDRPCPIDYDPKTCNNHKQRDKQTLFINRVKSEYTMDDTAFWTLILVG